MVNTPAMALATIKPDTQVTSSWIQHIIQLLLQLKHVEQEDMFTSHTYNSD